MEITEPLSVEDDSKTVEIVGRHFNRLLAEEMARDIELLSQIAPDSWSLQDNSALRVMRSAALSFAEPVGHGYVVEPSALDDAGRDLARIHGVPSGSKPYPSFVNVHLPIWNAKELALLRPGHEAALRKLVAESSGISPAWKNLNPELLLDLESVIGRTIPKPGYMEQWLALQEQPNVKGLLVDIPPPSAGVKYWKLSVSPERWDTMYEIGVVAHENWSSDPIHLDSLPTDYNAFVTAITKFKGIGKGAADHAWRFLNEMQIGDVVIPYSHVTWGWGTVTGDYFFTEDQGFRSRDPLPHRRAIKWNLFDSPRPVRPSSEELASQLWGIGPRELSYQAAVELLGGPPIASSARIPSMSTIRTGLAANGLSYTTDQIASFYTGLQTKGFVVLSGISGTGKSKIATGFVDLLPEGLTSSSQLAPQPDRIPLTVKPYMQKYRRVIFPKASLDLLPPLAVGEQREIQLTLGDIHGSGRIEHRAHSGGSSITVLYFRGSIGNGIANLKSNSKLFAEPVLDADGDRLASIRLTTEQALSETGIKSEPVSNHLFLSVRPDWRDSTSLLGYYNPLSSSYEWTDFLTFVLQAVENYKGPLEDRTAWFVILDEMNLAHVEYYFADLLSVIESGRDANGWTSEPLRFAYPETLEDDEVPPREVKLPPNLYIIGTVNMDETTHAFSPKVLDRAFTIELTDVSFEHYPPTISEPGHESALDADQKQALLQRFSCDGRFARIDKADITAFLFGNPEVRDWLQALNTRLATYRLHFGYRVFDEIVQYLANNRADADVPLKDAFDQAVLMKVLPKFTGSRARLETPLQSIWQWAVEPAASGIPTVEPGRGPVFPRVADKVQLMLATLERDGFVSFG